ncbi:MAG: fimbrillin family protein [Prevotella sp.]|nr:fimbrillin family protein [Prevotella sp.]
MILIKNILQRAIAATLFGMAVMAVVSCSQDDTLSRQTEAEPQPIGFNVVLDRQTASTRAVTSITDATFNAFDVWAFKADASKAEDMTYVMGVSASKGYQISRTSTYGVIDSVQQANSGTKIWGYANKRQETFWPSDGTQSLSFYALSPSTVNTAVTNQTVAVTKTSPSFTYTISHDSQTDIIAAGTTVNLTDINKYSVTGVIWMAVPLTFKHTMALVDFDAKLQSGYPNLSVTVYDITICNAYRKGTCTINPDGNTVSWGSLDTKETDAYKFTTGTTTDGITLNTTTGSDGAVATTVPLTNGSESTNSDNLLVIPQSLTKWDTSTAIVNTAGQSYLKIHCKITQNGFNLLTEDYVYVPFEAEWQPNKHYTYNLTFGLGRDSSGKSNGADITFTVTASDWAAQTAQNPGL